MERRKRIEEIISKAVLTDEFDGKKIYNIKLPEETLDALSKLWPEMDRAVECYSCGKEIRKDESERPECYCNECERYGGQPARPSPVKWPEKKYCNKPGHEKNLGFAHVIDPCLVCRGNYSFNAAIDKCVEAAASNTVGVEWEKDLNEPQRKTLEKMRSFFNNAAEIDIKFRMDGKDYWFEGDFLKQALSAPNMKGIKLPERSNRVTWYKPDTIEEALEIGKAIGRNEAIDEFARLNMPKGEYEQT